MALTEKALEAKRAYNREYQRKYRQKNKDKICQWQESYWERVAEKAEAEERAEMDGKRT